MLTRMSRTLVLAAPLLALCADGGVRRPVDTLPADFGASVASAILPKGRVDAPPPPAVLALGRRLFFDPILSSDRSVSCASCHDPAHGFADDRPLSPGVNGAVTVRNTPSLLNRGFGRRFSWLGQVETLEAQVLSPIANEREMGLSLLDAVDRLRADAEYERLFRATFDAPPDLEKLTTALSTFVARVTSPESAVDRFQAGDFTALDDLERAGLWLYESKARCWRCHTGPNYTDEDFHATGIGAADGRLAAGRFGHTEDERDTGRFKTPTLRGLAFTAPYMHDGSLATLEEVVAHYDRGAAGVPGLDERIEPLALSAEERTALLAFLRALSRPAH